MQYIKLTILAVSLLLFSGLASAMNSWKNYTFIEGVEVMDDGAFIIYLPTGAGTLCSGRAFMVSPQKNNMTTFGASNLLSLALAAYKDRTSINIQYNVIGSECYVTKLQMKKF